MKHMNNHSGYTNYTQKLPSILLAEDYEANQTVIQWYLDHEGYETDIAGNGKAAVEAFQLKNYDLVLMDIEMPIMDGYQATSHIRRIEKEMHEKGEPPPLKSLHIPIIAMTAHSREEQIERCHAAGMDDCITKPIRKEVLYSVIHKWLHKSIQKSSSMNVNMDAAIEEFGSRELFLEVADQFIQQMEIQIGVIQSAMRKNDSEQIRKELHSIKGGAATLEAVDILKAAGKLESLCKGGMESRMNDIFRELSDAFIQFKCLYTSHQIDTSEN